MKHRSMMVVALAAHAMAAMAQTVYESQDKAGAAFSDRPSAATSAVELQTPNVASAPAATPRPAAQPKATAPPSYRRLVIARPAEQATVHTSTGEFGISATASPPLRSSDRIRALLDGKLLPSLYRSTNLRISESDWRAAAVSNDGEHTLQLAIVDADGKPWIESVPVRFYVRHAAVGSASR